MRSFRTLICLTSVLMALLIVPVFAGQTPAAPPESAQTQPTPATNTTPAAEQDTADEAEPDTKQGTEAGTQDGAAEDAGEKGVEETLDKATGKMTEAGKALAQGDLKKAASETSDLLITYGVPAIAAFVVLIIGYFVAAFVAGLCSRPVRKRVDETLGRFVGKMVFYLIMISSLLGVLQYFGIGITSFAAILGAVGFAVGLAFQGTLSNFSAGVMLLVFRPFKVGDVINAAGITAKVFEIDLFATVFNTPDNRRIIVPNSAIASGTIENISFAEERRVDVAVGIDYGASLDQTREVLTSAAEALREKLVDGEGRGYQIALIDLGDSAVNWTVRFWTKAEDFWPVKEELTYQVKTRLDAASIGIPFPQMDVHLFNPGAAS